MLGTHVRALLRPQAEALLDRARSALPLHERAPSRGARAPAVWCAGRRRPRGVAGRGLGVLTAVCHEFGIKSPALTEPGTPPTVKDYVDGLNEYLLRTHAVGQNNVLIIDEAQNLSSDVLEQLRLLTNLETSERKLLQIVLIGQPELRGMLARPELEQLAQRVIARYHLDALSEKETAQYISHRLAVAGLKAALPFDSAALHRIHQLTRGVPRRINLLCDRALLGAYATGKSRVDRVIVDKAALEVFGAGGEKPKW